MQHHHCSVQSADQNGWKLDSSHGGLSIVINEQQKVCLPVCDEIRVSVLTHILMFVTIGSLAIELIRISTLVCNHVKMFTF
jgi:hypothetical protein